jgi:hypothetical protein
MENTVRKILTILAAVVAVAAVPGVASADVSNPTYTSEYSSGMDAGQTCSTPWQTGSYGAYGAQGFYIDGCTARINCPSYARSCNVYGTGTIGEWNYSTDSMNARLRMFDSRGSLLGFKDTSCVGYRGCTTPRLSGTLGPNGTATVQCNGVRRTDTVGYAKDTCRVEVFYNFV